MKLGLYACWFCRAGEHDHCTGKRNLDLKGDCLCAERKHKMPKVPDYVLEL